MSGVVVVDEWADAEEAQGETQDEKNQREIEEFILSNVLNDDDDDYQPSSVDKQTSDDDLAFAEIEKAMNNEEAPMYGNGNASAWGSGSQNLYQQYGDISSANGTNLNASTYCYQRNNAYTNSGEQQQYDVDAGQQDWFHESQECQCCNGYKYSCMCCQVDLNGYAQSECCTYCCGQQSAGYDYAHSTSSLSYAYSNQQQVAKRGNDMGKPSLLRTQAAEWTPGQGFSVPQIQTPAPVSQYPNTVFNAGKVHFPQSKTQPPSANTSICEFFVANGYCKHGKKCKFQHIML